MANAVRISDDLQEHVTDMIECSICMETLSSPKILPCIHTFCLRCLEKVGEDKRPGDNIACSMFRMEFCIPERGLSGLQNDYFLEKLTEINRISSMTSGRKVSCGICSEDDGGGESAIIVSTQMFCIDCHQHLCQ